MVSTTSLNFTTEQTEIYVPVGPYSDALYRILRENGIQYDLKMVNPTRFRERVLSRRWNKKFRKFDKGRHDLECRMVKYETFCDPKELFQLLTHALETDEDTKVHAHW